LFTDKGEDSGMESRGDQRGEPEVSEISIGDSRLSVLAKKGPIQVYCAKYSYDPYKYSPNENPEAELPLQAGDYVLIYGEMDEVKSMSSVSYIHLQAKFNFLGFHPRKYQCIF
jgi:hypothetical protein